MVIESTKVINSSGIGRPDYTGEQWQAQMVKKLELHANEVKKHFIVCASAVPSPFVWVVPAIAVGVPTYLIDVSTGLPMPFQVLAGYEFEVKMSWASFSQNHRLFGTLEGFVITNFFNDAMNIYYENEVFEFTTTEVDPFAIFPHLVAMGGENVGIASMTGYAEVIAILRLLHTEIPTTKQIKCKYCGNITTTTLDTTSNTCSKCGKLNLYFAVQRNIIKKV